MKHGKRPTVRQKKLLKSLRCNPDNWLVVTENNEQITIIHRHTDRVTTLNKRQRLLGLDGNSDFEQGKH